MMRTLFGYLLLAAALALAAVVLLTAGQMERQLAEADQAMAMVNLGDAARRARAGALNDGFQRVPVLEFDDGSVLVEPTNEQLAAKLKIE